MRKIYLFAVLLAVGFIIWLLWWLKPSDLPEPKREITAATSQEQTSDTASTSDLAAETSKRTPPATFTTGLEQMPPSLVGTSVDGDIIIDENQQLVPTRSLRQLFDYFLSGNGEEELSAIKMRVAAYIRYRTPEPAASQAVALFDDYLNYLDGLENLESQYGELQMRLTQSGQIDTALLSDRKTRVKSLRQQHFTTQEEAAFFTEDDQLDDYTLNMLTVTQNDNLSPEQKKAAIDDYVERLPSSPFKDHLKQQQRYEELNTRTKQLEAQGAGAEALFAMREQMVGREAAERLAVLDQEEAAFKQRFDNYQQQKQAIESSTADPATARQQVLELQQQMFDEVEQKRLDGYAAMQGLS